MHGMVASRNPDSNDGLLTNSLRQHGKSKLSWQVLANFLLGLILDNVFPRRSSEEICVQYTNK